MKTLKLLILAGILSVMSANTNGQTQVSQPFALMDSACFSVKPYYTSQLSFYMQPDSFALTNGYSPLNYPVSDTVRFARQRRLLIMVNNSHPVASITAVINKDSTGSVNSGKVYLEASNDGINWVRQNDTLSMTNITTNAHTWVLPTPISPTISSTINYNDYHYEFLPYLYYEILYVGVSTAKVDIHAYFVPRHRSTSPN